MHTHDFPEIFWVEEGRGLHRIDGQEKKLQSGDLIFVRSEDVHELRPIDSAGFRLVNLAFSAALLRDLLRRFPELVPVHRPGSTLPVRLNISALQLRTLKDELRRLVAAGNRRLPLERFLLGVYSLTLSGDRGPAPALPDWLETTCAYASRPEVFAKGVPALVRYSGRSAEHVARSFRKWLDVSPTDYLNRVRMEYAARELRLGSKPIIEIAFDCGFSNLAHFYALFRQAHGLTPRHYRLGCQRSVF